MEKFARSWVVLAAVLIAGCAPLLLVGLASSRHKNVSGDAALWGGYRPNAVYVITHDVFLEKRQDWAKLPILVAPGELSPVGQMEWDAPENIKEYANSPEQWPEVVGVISSGTRLQVQDVWKWQSPWASWLWVSAEILDGPYASQVVDIMDLSKEVGNTGEISLLGPDPKVLELMNDAWKLEED
jgi:hypothetical protein